MHQIATTLATHESENKPKREGGTWTNHKFTASDGTVFETGSQTLANQAYALLNQPVTATYEQNKYGLKLKTVVAGHVAGAPTGLAAAAAGAPTPASGAPAPSGGPASGGGWTPEKELRVSRFAALNSAGALIAAGVFPKPENRDQLFQMADILVGYAYNGREGAPVTQAAATVPQAQSTAPSPAVSGGDAGAAPTGAAPAATAPTGPNDDIPF